jgi:hypothetical protein
MIANLHDHLRASRQCLFFLRGAHKWMFPLTAGPARKTNEATVAIGDKEGRDEKGRGRKDAPRFRWRRPIHGGAGYERMPVGIKAVFFAIIWPVYWVLQIF